MPPRGSRMEIDQAYGVHPDDMTVWIPLKKIRTTPDSSSHSQSQPVRAKLQRAASNWLTHDIIIYDSDFQVSTNVDLHWSCLHDDLNWSLLIGAEGFSDGRSAWYDMISTAIDEYYSYFYWYWSAAEVCLVQIPTVNMDFAYRNYTFPRSSQGLYQSRIGLFLSSLHGCFLVPNENASWPVGHSYPWVVLHSDSYELHICYLQYRHPPGSLSIIIQCCEAILDWWRAMYEVLPFPHLLQPNVMSPRNKVDDHIVPDEGISSTAASGFLHPGPGQRH